MQSNVSVRREAGRRRRLWGLAAILSLLAGYMWVRILQGMPPFPTINLPEEAMFWLPGMGIVLLLGLVLVVPLLANGRSPHVAYRPEQIDIGFSEVKGLDRVVSEVDHTLNVMLDYQTFKDQMGGNPRRGILFEGPPGTGKTHLARAMAKEAGVPFLFVSSTAFQSMWYGMTARRIKAYFRALRKTARSEGGSIGFIEEIDAIGMRRQGSPEPNSLSQMTSKSVSADTGGVVNELLIQMQSFDEPTTGERFSGWFKDRMNRYLRPERQFSKRPAPYANILLIGATNRANALDPALLRPGRFDRVFHFDLPGRSARRELIDFFLEGKAHDLEMDNDMVRDDMTSATLGYSPAAIERLFDEALLLALHDGRTSLATRDFRQARVEVEIGLPEHPESPADEEETIAVHEAGHAVVAHLVGKGRKLEMLSIIKRREALGFLSHRLEEERHTQRRTELEALIQISMGGMAAEELFFGDSGSGPAGDLAAATNVAAEMVGSLGLGGSLISYRALDAGPLAGNLVAKVLSDSHGRVAVDAILDDQKERATRLLSANRHLVEALRDALLEHKELIDDEIIEVVTAAADREPAIDIVWPEPILIDIRDEETSPAAS